MDKYALIVTAYRQIYADSDSQNELNIWKSRILNVRTHALHQNESFFNHEFDFRHPGGSNLWKMTIFITLECASSLVNSKNIKEFQLWVLTPSWVSFGGVLGTQMEAKAIKKPSQKHINEMMPKWANTGPKGGPKMEPKSSNVTSWKHLASRVVPKWPPEPLQDRFWIGFGTIWDHFHRFSLTYVGDYCMHSLAACCKHKRSTSQGIIKRMQQRGSKKQLLSSCHLALKSSPAKVNELSGPC